VDEVFFFLLVQFIASYLTKDMDFGSLVKGHSNYHDVSFGVKVKETL
jgi:hypothetical protein